MDEIEDGKVEVIYNDEFFLRVFDGKLWLMGGGRWHRGANGEAVLTLVIVPVTYHTLDEVSEGFHRLIATLRDRREEPAARA